MTDYFLAEPPDGVHVLIGEWPLQTVLVRKDDRAAAYDFGDRRWFRIDAEGADPIAWRDLDDPDKYHWPSQPRERLHFWPEVVEMLARPRFSADAEEARDA